MCMSTQGELSLGLGQYLTTPACWVVLCHYHKCTVGHTIQCLSDITSLRELLSVTVIIESSYHDRIGISPYHFVFINKQLPTHHFFQSSCLHLICNLCCWRGVNIVGIVVIAYHREHSILCLNSTKHIHKRTYLLRFAVLQITGKHYHICILGINSIHNHLQQVLLATDIGANMSI